MHGPLNVKILISLFSKCIRNIAANIRHLYFELGNKENLKIQHLHVIET
jgi:hypothetical protein